MAIKTSIRNKENNKERTREDAKTINQQADQDSWDRMMDNLTPKGDADNAKIS